MADIQMGVVESRFADIIWENEPITSTRLASMSAVSLHWKKTTSFTVLKRLCDKGIFQNIKGTVTSLISKNDYNSLQSAKFVDETFSGSLPAFLTAFTAHKPLSADEVAELRRMVAEYGRISDGTGISPTAEYEHNGIMDCSRCNPAAVFS